MITLFNYTYSAIFQKVNEDKYITYFGGYISTISKDSGYCKLHIKDSGGSVRYYKVLSNLQESIGEYLRVLREYHPPIKWVHSPEQSNNYWERYVMFSVSDVYYLDVVKGDYNPLMLSPEKDLYTEAYRKTSKVKSIFSGDLSTAIRKAEETVLFDFIQFYVRDNEKADS